jgi:serine/threonine protein kinase
MHELAPGDPELIGPYRLRGRLGAGGMGRVYLGLSPGGRAVAVKVIRADLAQDAEFLARFRREVAVARTVSGLFTAPVIDADVDGPVPWLATAYVPGPSLADAVSEYGPLPAASVLALARGLAEALSAIHAAGVVHRDLKPANVLLAGDGPRVIDFGISRAVEASALTHTGLVVGSPGFMSPEQAEGREVGPPSDIFSLGAVLAFAATGQGPFGSGSTPALVYRVVHSGPQLDLMSAEVRPLAERCLAKDPALRPTATGLLAAAASPAAGWLPEPVTRALAVAPPTMTAPPPTAPASAPGPARTDPRRGGRRRALAAAAVIAGIVAGGTTAGVALAAHSAPAHQAQSAGRTAPPQTVAPASTPASSAPASPAAAAPGTPPATAPVYTPPPSTPPATMTPPPSSSAPPSPTTSPSPSTSSSTDSAPPEPPPDSSAPASQARY